MARYIDVATVHFSKEEAGASRIPRGTCSISSVVPATVSTVRAWT